MLLDEPPAVSRPAARRELRFGALTVAATLVALVPLAVHAWAALHGGFYQDDFLITYRAAHAGPFDPSYLFQDYQGHLAPGTFMLAWLVTAIAPLHHAVAVVPLLLGQVAAAALFWCLLVRCFGRRWALLVPFTVFAASTLLLVPTLWWAYGIQLVPVVLATAGALHAHVRYLQEGRRRHAAYTVLWVLAGLACYEKAVLIPLLLVVVTVLLGEPVRRHPRMWLAHGALLVAYVAVYLSATSSPVSLAAAGPGDIAELARHAVLDTLLPGLLGGVWSQPAGGAAWAGPAPAVQVGLVAVAVAVVAAGVRRGGRRAWLAWGALAGVVVVDIALVAMTRMSSVGPIAGSDPRYVADAVPIAALAGAFAFLRPGAATPPRWERPVALGVSALLLLGSVLGFGRLAPALRFEHSTTYLANARAAVERNPDLVLFDSFVPGDIVHEWFAADSRASRVVGLVPGVRFDEPAESVHVLGEDGVPRPVVGIDPVAAAPPGPVAGCGYPAGEELVRIPLDKPVLGRHLLRIDYYTAAGGEGVVDRDGHRTPVWFQSGLHTVYLPIDGLFDKVGVQLAGRGAPACVAAVQVGTPRTGPG